jgi:uncharacterized membrane protein YqaE (UPF0057 family)
MRFLNALILRQLAFLSTSGPVLGFFCLLLQVTLIGWIPAAIWAVYALSPYKTDRKIERAFGLHV